MNNTNPVLDRIESAERMLRHARMEYQRGNPQDATEFLAAARRNIDRAGEAMKAEPTQTAAIVNYAGGVSTKVAEVVAHRREAHHAR